MDSRASLTASIPAAAPAPSETLAPARSEARWWLLVAAVTLLALALRVLLLGEKSLWLDEAFSVHLARDEAAVFWRELARREANGALYFVLLRGWLAFGEAEATARSLSVAAAVATVPILAALGRRLLGPAAGLAAALLLAVNAAHVSHAQTARGYALLILLITAATLLFVRAVERPSAVRWVAYALASALALYAHLFAAFVVAAQLVSLALLPPQRVAWRGLAAALAGLALAALPLGLFVAFRRADQIDWIGEPGAYDLAYALWALAGPGLELATYAILTALGMAGAARAALCYGRSPPAWRCGLAPIWLITPFGLALLASVLKPVFVPRYLGVCQPALVLLAAAGLEQLRPRALRGAALAVVLVLAAGGLALHYRPALAPAAAGAALQAVPPVRALEAGLGRRAGHEVDVGELLRTYLEREDWRSATRHVMRAAAPNDALVFYPPYVRRPFDYYRRKLGRAGAGPQSVFPSVTYAERYPSAELVQRLARTHSRVWVVVSHEETTPRDRQVARELLEERLPSRYAVHEMVEFDGVRVHLFSASASGLTRWGS